MTRLVLASASPARLETLRSAGIDPLVRVSDVDEPAVLAAAADAYGQLEPADAVLLLARAKALDVAAAWERDDAAPSTDVVVVGCDSMLELDGQIHGKPASAAQARERWQAMRGASGVLHTGHWLVDLREDEEGGTGGTIGASSATVVHFADLSDAEIDAYVATGEPLAVAGAFTIDGLGGPFVRGVEGDPHAVVGISLPLLRDLLGDLALSVPSFWRPRE